SIQEGASEAEMALIRLLGTQNVIVQSVKPDAAVQVGGGARTRLLDYGLKRGDLERLRNIPHVMRVVPLREVAFDVRYGHRRRAATVVGVEPALFDTIQLELSQGRFL